MFLGVIAGTAVTLLTQWVIQKCNEGQKINNLKFEIDFNIKNLDDWSENLNEYRNAVNAEDPTLFVGYFDLSRTISITATDMFRSGQLYKLLGREDIGKLQGIFGVLSVNGANAINNQITQQKTTFDKSRALSELFFWDRTFKEYRKTFEDVLNKLPS